MTEVEGSGGTPGTPAPAVSGPQVLAALAGLPGGAELLDAARARSDLALVGGAVRDLLLGRAPRELDVVLDAGAGAFADELAAAIGTATGDAPVVTVHERFGTAALEWPGGRIDIAERRAETYDSPGALPRVRAAEAREDLARRDFTVNAIALPLAGDHRGELQHPEHALADLRAGLLRALHDRSFIEDPTRLLRLARYRARLGFDVEPHTAALAEQALRDTALARVSRARVGAELRLALGEGDAVASLESMAALGALAAIDPSLRIDRTVMTRALALLPDDPPQARADLLALAALLDLGAPDGARSGQALFALLDGLEFTAADRDRVVGSVLGAGPLAHALASTMRPSELHAAVAGEPLEAVALAGAIAGEGSPGEASARLWLDSLRHVRLAIGGEELLAAGVPAGPELGRRLAIALARRLDGELADGAEAELDAALEARP